MTVQLDHTIIAAHDKASSARFLTEILGLPAPEIGHFAVVDVGGVSLDFAQTDGAVTAQHYAFLIDDDTFDEVFSRVVDRGLTYWADPYRRRPGEIRTTHGGRGLYFEDPNGHLMEVLTRP